jgi:hypothetical protein
VGGGRGGNKLPEHGLHLVLSASIFAETGLACTQVQHEVRTKKLILGSSKLFLTALKAVKWRNFIPINQFTSNELL